MMEASAEALTYVDDLIEASFGLDDALTRLESGRLARESAARDLTPSAVDLLGRLVRLPGSWCRGLTLTHPDDTGLGRALFSSLGCQSLAAAPSGRFGDGRSSEAKRLAGTTPRTGCTCAP
jgi:hypothetical protein